MRKQHMRREAGYMAKGAIEPLRERKTLSELVSQFSLRPAPVSCTRCYESTVWVTGKGSNPGFRLCG